MRLTSFVVWRSWASSPLRPALSILGVALGIAIVVAIHVVDHNTIQSQILARNPDFGRVDLELTPLGSQQPAEQLRAELSSDPRIAEVAVLTMTFAQVVFGGQAVGDVELVGLAPVGPTSFRHYTIADGEDLTDLDGEGACLLGGDIAHRHGLRVGDRLVLAPPVA